MNMLEENVLDARQESYLEWLCLAPSQRSPSTKKAYAELIGVAETTLTRWQRKDTFVRRWRAQVDEIVGSPDMTQELIQKLHREAMDGDVAAAKLYFQVTNQLQPPTQKIEVRRASDLSNEDLEMFLAKGAATELATRAAGG